MISLTYFHLKPPPARRSFHTLFIKGSSLSHTIALEAVVAGWLFLGIKKGPVEGVIGEGYPTE